MYMIKIVLICKHHFNIYFPIGLMLMSCNLLRNKFNYIFDNIILKIILYKSDIKFQKKSQQMIECQLLSDIDHPSKTVTPCSTFINTYVVIVRNLICQVPSLTVNVSTQYYIKKVGRFIYKLMILQMSILR